MSDLGAGLGIGSGLASAVGTLGSTGVLGTFMASNPVGIGLAIGAGAMSLASKYDAHKDLQDKIDKTIDLMEEQRTNAINDQREYTNQLNNNGNQMMNNYMMTNDKVRASQMSNLYNQNRGNVSKSILDTKKIRSVYDQQITRLNNAKSDFDWLGNTIESGMQSIQQANAFMNMNKQRKEDDKIKAVRDDYYDLVKARIGEQKLGIQDKTNQLNALIGKHLDNQKKLNTGTDTKIDIKPTQNGLNTGISWKGLNSSFDWGKLDNKTNLKGMDFNLDWKGLDNRTDWKGIGNEINWNGIISGNNFGGLNG